MKKKNRKKILIVEDEKILSEVYEEKLKSLGFDVCCAYSKDEALNLFNSFLPDLVLLDLMLPEKVGFQILEDMKRKNPDLPVIIISNLDQSEDIKKGKSLGAEDFLIKSNVRLVELVSAVKRCLS